MAFTLLSFSSRGTNFKAYIIYKTVVYSIESRAQILRESRTNKSAVSVANQRWTYPRPQSQRPLQAVLLFEPPQEILHHGTGSLEFLSNTPRPVVQDCRPDQRQEDRQSLPLPSISPGGQGSLIGLFDDLFLALGQSDLGLPAGFLLSELMGKTPVATHGYHLIYSIEGKGVNRDCQNKSELNGL
jgi:hypothetical protein